MRTALSPTDDPNDGQLLLLFPSQAAALHELPTFKSDPLDLLIAFIPEFIGLGSGHAPDGDLPVFALRKDADISKNTGLVPLDFYILRSQFISQLIIYLLSPTMPALSRFIKPIVTRFTYFDTSSGVALDAITTWSRPRRLAS